MLVYASAVLLMAGCGSGGSESCVSNEVGEVCADGGEGRVTFNARGLEPGSEIELVGPDDASVVLPVGPDGTYEMESGAQGYLSVFADTEVRFTVSAVDDGGNRLDGQLAVST